MPYYCTVPRCTSMAGKAKNVSFHQFPRDVELAKLWNKILKRGKPYTKYSKVCSLHFTPEDYTITSIGKKGQWRTLRKDAIPSQNLPSESPTPYQRKQWVSWTPTSPNNVLDTTIQQQMAQAIYMQTMLALQSGGGNETPSLNNGVSLPVTSNPPIAHTSNTADSDILKGKQTNTEEKTSYKCIDCSKCFKDPDVFLLHKRTHKKHEKNEKENFNLNRNLQANPILANLLKTNNENANIFDSNMISVENLLVTALAANVEGYMRSFTAMIKNEADSSCGRDDSNYDRDDSNYDRDDANYDRADSNYDRADSNRVKGEPDDEDEVSSNSENLDNEVKIKTQNFSHSNSKYPSLSDSTQNLNSDEVIRDRIKQLYKHDYDVNLRFNDNINVYENSENGVPNDCQGNEQICDNESIDSNLVIDESLV